MFVIAGVGLNISPSDNGNGPLYNYDRKDTATQTEVKLSHNTPRKKALRRRCDAAEKRARRAIVKNKKQETDTESKNVQRFRKTTV